MHFTKVQISKLMRKHAEKENGRHDLMEIMLESMMVAERSEFLHENPQNKGAYSGAYPFTFRQSIRA